MDILIVMCLGILVGKRFFPKKRKKINERLQLACTLLLIFSMGVMLGQKENFFQDLSTLGVSSFIFFLIPTIFSILSVYLLTERFMVKRKKENPVKGMVKEEW